jgi:predicted nuclease with TOPRIM domain
MANTTTPANALDMGAFAGMLPAGMLDMLADAQARAAELDDGAERIEQLAAELRECREQLKVTAATNELLADMLGRLVPAWNALATNVDALTEAMSGPIARIGLQLVRVPRL